MPRPRKKRSSTDKPSKRKRNPILIVVIVCATLLMLLMVALLVVSNSIKSWLQGDGFRQFVITEATEALDSEIELGAIQWESGQAYTDRFVARGYEDAAFQKMELEAIRAQFDGVKAQAVQVPEVTINRFSLLFSDRRLEDPRSDEPLIQDQPKSGPAIPGFLSGLVPNKAEIGEIRVSSASILGKNETGADVFVLADTGATIRPDLDVGIWEIAAKGGRILIAEQRPLELQSLRLRWKGEDIFIDDCALGVFSEGLITGSGEIRFREETQFDFDVEISDIEIDELVEGEWKERLDGSIEGPIKITGTADDLVTEGTLHIVDGTVKAMPMLDLIAKYTKAEQFKRLSLTEAKTDFTRRGDRIELRNLALQSDGLVRVEGEVDLIGNAIDGRLKVGVVPGTLRWIPGAQRKVFTEDRDGFLWTPVAIGGTTDDPTEDLSQRLIAAAGSEILEALPGSVIEKLRGFLGGSEEPGPVETPTEDDPDDSTSTLTEEAEDTVREIDPGRVLDLISPFLR
ncbi:MAG: hypothetical protein AAF236_11650 [Verrucomicrobiota bacterium]